MRTCFAVLVPCGSWRDADSELLLIKERVVVSTVRFGKSSVRCYETQGGPW